MECSSRLAHPQYAPAARADEYNAAMNLPTGPHRRNHGRDAGALRPCRIEIDVLKFAEGSALIELGDTRVLCAASADTRVPAFLKESGQGWVTAEYSMLPRATHTRTAREVASGRPSGFPVESESRLWTHAPVVRGL